MIQSPVQQLIINRTASELTAQGVVYKDQLTGDLLNATARKEVIMSAGAFQTPQLMMLSVRGFTVVLKGTSCTDHLAFFCIGYWASGRFGAERYRHIP